MYSISMGLDGFDKLKRTFQTIQKKPDIVEKEVKRVADLFQKEMRSTISFNDNIDTRHLIDESLYAQQTDKHIWQVSAITTRKDFDYARAIEYGTYRHRAYPFFSPAYWSAEQELYRRLKKVMKL